MIRPKKILNYLITFRNITTKMIANKIFINDYVNDKIYLKIMWKLNFGAKTRLNLKNPKSFNEKLQWLKLYDKNPAYTKMVDKYLSKKWAADIIGKKYIVPTYDMWIHTDDIDISTLPNKFVLKTNHDSGGIVICKDKATFDLDVAKKKLASHLKRNYFYLGREWPYKNVRPVIFAEKYLVDTKLDDLIDYKFFCNNGEVDFMFIASDRMREDVETKFDFFDKNFNHLPFTNGHPNAKHPIMKPINFDLMCSLASKLSKNIPHVRVDFFQANGQIFFGEMTFYHWGGFVPFDPPEWDERLGDLIDLSNAYCYQ